MFLTSAAVGFSFFPYREMMGMPVCLSVSLPMPAPASAVPRKPCSGAKMVTMLMPSFCKVSTRCVLPMREV